LAHVYPNESDVPAASPFLVFNAVCHRTSVRVSGKRPTENWGLPIFAPLRTCHAELGTLDLAAPPKNRKFDFPNPRCGLVDNAPSAHRGIGRGKRFAFPTARPFAHKLHSASLFLSDYPKIIVYFSLDC
jgi:hypothetical protein